MAGKPATMRSDSTPHASLGNHDADQAGSCFSLLKKPLAVEELAEKLMQKGLAVSSVDELTTILKTHGYYRLKGYWLTFEKGAAFKANTTLAKVLEVEAFDRELSSFIFALIGDMEICLRSQCSTVLALHYGSDALHHPEAFKNSGDFQKLQKSLECETNQAVSTQKPLAMHHLEKYGRIPIWAEMENTSFGTLSKLYGNLAEKSVASEISAIFKVNWLYLRNWLRHLTQIRNICAHHDRLYNKMFTVNPRLYKEYRGLHADRLFATFIVLFRLHEALDPERTNLLRGQLGRIVDAHPTVDLKPVGFPDNWREVLRIPSPDTRDLVRPRGRQGGRPLKNAAVIEQALYQYDMREGSVAEIAKRCGLSLSTLYKYIHQREEAGGYTYQAVSLEAE